jgi:hypothetical protein
VHLDLTLQGTVDTFDAANFTNRLGACLRVAPARITLDIRAASVLIGVNIATDSMAQGQRLGTLLSAYNETSFSAALGDGYVVETLSRPTLLTLSSNGSSVETQGALSGVGAPDQEEDNLTRRTNLMFGLVLSATALALSALGWRLLRRSHALAKRAAEAEAELESAEPIPAESGGRWSRRSSDDVLRGADRRVPARQCAVRRRGLLPGGGVAAVAAAGAGFVAATLWRKGPQRQSRSWSRPSRYRPRAGGGGVGLPRL